MEPRDSLPFRHPAQGAGVGAGPAATMAGGPPLQHESYVSINSLPLAQAALAYARQGYKVIPLQPNSKLPMRGWSWKRAATNDPTLITSWWQQWPDANIGLVTGAESGIDILDIDVKNGQEGMASYQEIVQERYDGPVQQTPSGGWHLLFRHQTGLTNFTRRGEYGGLDMRTDGGYVVAAPSTTPGGQYIWVAGGEVPVMPPPLQSACQHWSRQSSTEIIEAPEIAKDLPDITDLRLDPKYLNYLQDGDTSPWSGDESAAIFATSGALMHRLNDARLVYGIMLANPYVWACAERHRQFGDPATWLWKYGIGKMVTEARTKSAQEVFSAVPQPPTVARPSGSWIPPWSELKTGDLVRTKAPPLPMLVEHLIPRAGVSAIVGPPGQGKTQLSIQLGINVATGTPLLGHPNWATHIGKVMVVDCEDDRDEFHRRLQAILAAQSTLVFQQDSISENLAFWHPSGIDTRLTNPQGEFTGLVHEIATYLSGLPEKPHALVLGPAINMLGQDETNEGLARLTAAWKYIAETTGCAVIGVHHTTKQSTLNVDRGETSARGGGSFTASVRAQIHIQNMGQDEAKALGIADDRSQYVGISLPKANGFQRFEEPVWFQRLQGSPVMLYMQNQPRPQGKSRNQQAEYDGVVTIARGLLGKRDTPVALRAFSDEYGGASGLFGMGENKLRGYLQQACQRGDLPSELRSSPNNRRQSTYLLPFPGRLGGSETNLTEGDVC